MELTTDFLLRGPVWVNTIEKLSPIFKTRTNYEIFMVCLAIGIMYDQRIKSFEDEDTDPKNVPRNVIQNNDDGRMDFMLQSAILATKTVNMTEDERLELAFGEKKENEEFNKHDFILSFANFGVTKLAELVGDSEIESMEKIKYFLVKTMEGKNYDIDALPDELLLEDDEY